MSNNKNLDQELELLGYENTLSNEYFDLYTNKNQAIVIDNLKIVNFYLITDQIFSNQSYIDAIQINFNNLKRDVKNLCSKFESNDLVKHNLCA